MEPDSYNLFRLKFSSPVQLPPLHLYRIVNTMDTVNTFSQQDSKGVQTSGLKFEEARTSCHPIVTLIPVVPAEENMTYVGISKFKGTTNICVCPVGLQLGDESAYVWHVFDFNWLGILELFCKYFLLILEEACRLMACHDFYITLCVMSSSLFFVLAFLSNEHIFNEPTKTL